MAKMEHEITELTLRGGMRGLAVHVPNATVMSMQIHFRAGSRFVEDYREKWETAHIMEHMAFGANSEFASAHKFDEEFTRNGAYLNAWTSDIGMCYIAECADFEWERILELQRLAICHPVFKKSEFEGEYGNVKSELTGFLGKPNRVLWPKISQEIGEDLLTFGERLKLMPNIHINDVRRHHEKTHTRGNMRFIIAGNLEGRMTRLTKIMESFDLPEGERLPIPVDELHAFEPFAIRRGDAPNITFGWTMNLPRHLSEQESVAMKILDYILNGSLHSRIQGRARKKGLVYGIWSDTNAYEHNSSWDFGAEANEEKIDDLFKIIVREVENIKNGEIADEDLADAKSYTLGRTQIGVQTVAQLNNWLSNRYFVDGVIEERALQLERINAVSKDDVIEIAREFIATKTWGLGIYGNTNKEFATMLHARLAKIYEG